MRRQDGALPRREIVRHRLFRQDRDVLPGNSHRVTRPAPHSLRSTAACRYLIGGLEKWLVEKRPLSSLNARTLSDLRAVPTHRNQSVLLDTAQVRNLIDKGAAALSTCAIGRVRQRPLPNAIKSADPATTPTEQLKANRAINSRSSLPCYDRRSSSFGSAERELGYDYRSPYTVRGSAHPIEPRPLHIKEWLAGDPHWSWFQRPPKVAAAVLHRRSRAPSA